VITALRGQLQNTSLHQLPLRLPLSIARIYRVSASVTAAATPGAATQLAVAPFFAETTTKFASCTPEDGQDLAAAIEHDRQITTQCGRISRRKVCFVQFADPAETKGQFFNIVA
jgi:hypothetical protein